MCLYDKNFCFFDFECVLVYIIVWIGFDIFFEEAVLGFFICVLLYSVFFLF